MQSVFVACFLAVVLANVAVFFARDQLVRLMMKLAMRRAVKAAEAQGLKPGEYISPLSGPDAGKVYPIALAPTFTCEHCGKDSELR